LWTLLAFPDCVVVTDIKVEECSKAKRPCRQLHCSRRSAGVIDCAECAHIKERNTATIGVYDLCRYPATAH
jgi:ribosomal protein L32